MYFPTALAKRTWMMLLVMFTTVSGHKHGGVCLPGHMFLLGFGFRLRTDFTSRRHTPTMMETLFDVLVKDGETRASLLRIVVQHGKGKYLRCVHVCIRANMSSCGDQAKC